MARPPFPFSARAAGILILAAGGAVPALHAELTWAQQTVELQADARADVLEARFHFTNGGTTPVDIRQVQTSCGCTTATLAQYHYEPGQSGEIVARYTVGGHVGFQKKSLLVSTSDQNLPTALTLVVHIPELLHVEPPAVTWARGEPNTAKLMQIESARSEEPIHDVSVSSSDPRVSAELQTVAEGGKYQLRVTPAATDQPVFTTLTIRFHLGAVEKTSRVFASVQGPPATPPARPQRPYGSGP